MSAVFYFTTETELSTYGPPYIWQDHQISKAGGGGGEGVSLSTAKQCKFASPACTIRLINTFSIERQPLHCMQTNNCLLNYVAFLVKIISCQYITFDVHSVQLIKIVKRDKKSFEKNHKLLYQMCRRCKQLCAS